MIISTTIRIDTKKAIAIGLLIEVLIAVFAFANEGTSGAGWQTLARISGRFSLVIFSALFVLQARHRYLLPKRPFLVFAVVHGIHLIELLIYISLSQGALIPIRLAGGFVAYLIIFTMPWLESQFAKNRISSALMSWFENISLYYIWFIFLMAYIPRVLGKLPGAGGSYVEHVVLLVWVLLIFAWRFVIQLRGYIVKNG